MPTVPGYHGDAQDDATLAKAAAKIGFPVLIKASAGGGGRGMRRVDHANDFVAELDAAKAEAEAAFGDNAVLLEKYILNPRHLEVQLAGDRFGNLVHLFERDCSVQRNNQKVLEEAPAPNLPESVRQKLYDAALKLGRAIGYDSAGTVEFIMDQRQRQSVFPRDEHAAAGRASRHRVHHRRRSGRVAIAGGGRREDCRWRKARSAPTAMRSRRASPPNAPTSDFSRSPASCPWSTPRAGLRFDTGVASRLGDRPVL